MKIMSVVGARPNFMKVAPIIAAIRDYNLCQSHGLSDGTSVSAFRPIEHVLVHTGQHYDEAMSGCFFDDLGLPVPDSHLGVGSGSHAAQTAEIMKEFEVALLRERPDVVMVVGDVNSTLACSLVAAKISFDASGTRPLIAHVEAGLRSFDRTMPEEINRILTDHLADLLFVTEESGLRNLSQEGIASEKAFFVGNTMIDSLLRFKERADASMILDALGLRTAGNRNGSSQRTARYALLTLHRPANVDCLESFLDILEGLEELAVDWPVIFPAHPRTQKRIKQFSLERYFAARHDSNPMQGSWMNSPTGIRMMNPLGYLDFLCLMKNASLVITDSGGIQEETTCLGIPCVTVRENTERPVTVSDGTNVLAGVCSDGIRNAVRRQRKADGRRAMPEKWDGKSADRILDVINGAVQKREIAAQSSSKIGETTEHLQLIGDTFSLWVNHLSPNNPLATHSEGGNRDKD